MDWGTVGSRSWHVAVRSKYHRTLVSSSCCLKAVWESPRKFSLFCGFWENLEHKFTKKMDVWITSCKQTQSLYPSVFPAGKKHSFTKLGEVWRPASGLAPPLALQWGGLLGEAGGMKPAAWSVKEGCLKAGGISQHLGPRPGSQRRKEFGQWTQKRREKDFVFTPPVPDNQRLSDEQNRRGDRAAIQGALGRWPLHPSLWNAAPQQS